MFKQIILPILLVISCNSCFSLTDEEKLDVNAAKSWFLKQNSEQQAAAFQSIILKCKMLEEELEEKNKELKRIAAACVVLCN